jgi:beta-lactamase superfamily II metal-dependent hydrolase
MKKLSLNILKAFSGDCILLSYFGTDSKNHYILVDGGMPNTYRTSIKHILEDIDYIDMIFITHIDRDHIGGILKLLSSSNKDKVKNIFFNSGDNIRVSDSLEISENDGKSLVDYINKLENIKTNLEEITTQTDSFKELYGLSIEFLSPTKDLIDKFNNEYKLGKVDEESKTSLNEKFISDSKEKISQKDIKELSEVLIREKSINQDITNAVSLAMLITYYNKKILLLGDAKDSILIKALQNKGYSNKNGARLSVDYIKISHHGSKYHTNISFLSYILCDKFIFSTNGSGNSSHPNIEVLSRILCHKDRDKSKTIYFYFNYPKDTYIDNSVRLLTEKEEKDYNCKCIYDHNLIEIMDF